MKDRPVIVHNLEDARTAVRVAAELGCPVTLRSAPGAAAYLGPQVFRDMIEEATGGHGGMIVEAVFDCGDDPGLALAALRQGLKVVRIDAPRETFEKIADIAARTGARVEDPGAPGGEPLDLLDVSDAQAAIRIWLSED
jgi:fructose/tagatose bisphosphate aldolase